MIRRVTLALAALTLTLGLGGLFAVSASASTGTPCYQSSCDGLDPTLSYNRYTGYECNTGAYTVPGGTFNDIYSGTLEMRWGPDCEVNWGRYTVGTRYSGSEFYLSITGSDGTTNQYDFYGYTGITYYSNEVFSPGPATVCLGFVNNGSGIPPTPFCWTQPSS